MHPNLKPSRFVLPLAAAVLVAACGGSGGPGWTYAPLGPSAPPATSSLAPTPAPSGDVLVLELKTTDADPLAFEPKMLEAPAHTLVTVNYLNDSSLPHNANFFDGPDQNATSLGKTDIVTGPGALESVTFTTPEQPGDYFFWCDVHGVTMTGTLHVTQ